MSKARTVASTAVAAAAGMASWTLAEYGLHGYLMHHMRGRGLASKEHLRHHADVTYFSPASKKAASAAAATAVVLPVAWRLVGRRRALAYNGGVIGMYLVYEALHRRTHTHPPRTAHGRWMRRSHLYHHVGNPMGNFGVTTSVWDRAFGSYTDPGVVTVPRRIAPVWLLDEAGEVRPEYAADYRARGRSHADAAQVQRDHDRAWANEPPESRDDDDDDRDAGLATTAGPATSGAR